MYEILVALKLDVLHLIHFLFLPTSSKARLRLSQESLAKYTCRLSCFYQRALVYQFQSTHAPFKG